MVSAYCKFMSLTDIHLGDLDLQVIVQDYSAQKCFMFILKLVVQWVTREIESVDVWIYVSKPMLTKNLCGSCGDF